MRVAIRWDLCIGAGRCVATSEGGFALVADGDRERAIFVSAARERELLEAAARGCPTMAIRLWDADGRPVYPPPAVGAP